MVLTLTLGALAFLISLLLTPLVRDVFLKIGVVDVPDGERKSHRKNIPRVGGIAIFLSYTIAYAALAMLTDPVKGPIPYSFDSRNWLFAGVTVIFATGLLDDLLTLRPKQKLLGQIIAATLVWCGGIEINLFHNMPAAHWLSFPVTVFWLVACTNAFNLIDGLDGLAAGAGFFATATMIVAAILDHNLALALATVPLAGSLLAFLCFNFNPASVFLGDCGSLTIGFLLGCFGMMWSQKITTLFGLSAPLMAVSLPLLDTSIAIARRVLRNRPVFSPDRGHIHHRLLDRGNSPRQTALLLYGACLITGIFSLSQQLLHWNFGPLVLLGFLISAGLAVNYLGYLEFAVAGQVLSRKLLFRIIEDEIKIHQLDSSLTECGTERERLETISKACRSLGFKEAFVASKSKNGLDHKIDLSVSHISISIDRERVLVLQEFPGDGRPLPMDRLLSVIRTHLQQIPPPGDREHLLLNCDLESENVAIGRSTAA
jgi:UDP-GlcNAc:undecaprenyl-phosphate/decaprenyl-phosphate GlcNAc-1-phosphate transferase